MIANVADKNSAKPSQIEVLACTDVVEEATGTSVAVII